MRFEIRFYLTEQAKRSGITAYKETVNGDKNFAENYARNKLRSSKFVTYDIVQK